MDFEVALIDVEVVVSRLHGLEVGSYLLWKTGKCELVISFLLKPNDIRHCLITLNKKSQLIKEFPEIDTYEDAVATTIQKSGVLFLFGVPCPETGLGSNGQVNPFARRLACSICQELFSTNAKKTQHANSHKLTYCSRYGTYRVAIN